LANQHFAALCAASLVLAACGGPKTFTKPPADGSVIGMTQRDYKDADRLSWDRQQQRPLSTTIWYPAAAEAKMTEIAFPAENPIFVGGWAAKDASPVPAPDNGGKRPLIVLSHGTGGSALQMMWLARRLAARGYVVAAVDHHGNSAAEARYDARGFRMPWERALDISAIIDALLADPEFEPLIDASRIYGAGYSLGGYTMTALAGGETSLARLAEFCNSRGRDATCDKQPEFPDAEKIFNGLLGDDPSLRVRLGGHSRSFVDPRIKSFVLIAPALAQAFSDDSLLKISAPLLVIGGDADTTAPIATNAKRIADKVRNSRTETIRGARHYSFLDECAPKARRWIDACKDGPGVNRGAGHDEVADYAAKFFSETR
jgi:predicted dienelactone hydrolase